LFSIHFCLLLFVLLADKFLQFIEHGFYLRARERRANLRLGIACTFANNFSAVFFKVSQVAVVRRNSLIAPAAATIGQAEIAKMMAKSSASMTNSQLFSLAK
jgi:hypothetical protein